MQYIHCYRIKELCVKLVIETSLNVFRFSGSGGGPHRVGGCRVLVGALFQKACKLQTLQKSSDLPVQRSAQWTVLLFKGEYALPGKTQHHLSSLLTSVYVLLILGLPPHFDDCHAVIVMLPNYSVSCVRSFSTDQ
jgi:hypothetical protein